MKHLNAHNILSNAQHGFRQNHSCESHTVNDLAKALDDGKQIDAMVLDFTKAFDKVSHKHLFAKLLWYPRTNTQLDTRFSYKQNTASHLRWIFK